jgi:hypothetical protein
MKVSLRPHAWAPHQLGLALLASACAHAFLLAAVLRPSTQIDTPKISQQRGSALTVVSLLNRPNIPKPSSRVKALPVLPPKPKKPPVVVANAQVIVPKAILVAPQKPDSPSPPPPAVAEPAATPPPAPQPTPPVRLGAQFANLFAPIVNQPLGRAHWGSFNRPAPPPQPDPAQMRQQAQVALSSSLVQRLEGLRASRLAQNQPIDCLLKVDSDRREGQLTCQDASDAAQVWGALQGLLHAPDETQTPHNADAFCLRLNPAQTMVQTCPTDP